MVLNHSSETKVWAYGIDNIMAPPDPLDLSGQRMLFPHVLKVVFTPTEKKEVDILMGNNFL